MLTQHSSSSAALSSNHSSHSVASGTDAQQHGGTQGGAASAVPDLRSQASMSDGEQSKFMKKLQEFQRGTDRLQKQMSLNSR